MRVTRWVILLPILAGLGLRGTATTVPPPATPEATLFGIGDVPGGDVISLVRDAVRVGGTLYAVGGSAALPRCPQPPGVACSSLGNADSPVLWTWDGSTATLTALPHLATGSAFAQAGALTPDAAHLASMVRANGPRAARVTLSSLTGMLGNSDSQLLTTNTQTGTYRIFDDLNGQPDFLYNAPHAAVSISHDGQVLYGGVRQYTRAARFDVSTGTTTLIPLLSGRTENLPAPRAASADGQVMVGTAFSGLGSAIATQIYPNHYPSASSSAVAGRTAFRYVHGSPGVATAIPGPAGNTWSTAAALTADGDLALVAGNSTAWPKGQSYLYRASTGLLTELGSPNKAWTPTGFGGVSADGSVVAVSYTGGVGRWNDLQRYGYIRNSHGWFPLAAVLHEAGVDVAAQGWEAFMIAGMSPDATLVFGYARHHVGSPAQPTPEGFVIEFAPGYLANFNPAPTPPANTTIVGAWTDSLTTPSAVALFMADGTYYTIGQTGFERGLYRYDGTSLRVVTLQDTNGDDGISDANTTPSTVSVVGDELRAPAGCTPGVGECELLHRVLGGPGSIVGGWRLGDPSQPDNSAAIVLFANGTFFMAEDRPADAYGQDGHEIGTYAWNATTGAFAATSVTTDTSGEWGLSHMSGLERLGLTADELQVVSIDGIDNTQAFRVVDPQTVVPVVTSALAAAGTATVPFSYAITASRALTFGLSDAPAWMSVDSDTGVVTGTPPAAGAFTATISATNSFGDTGSATLTLSIAPPNTSTGTGVTVAPAVPAGGGTVTLSFSDVLAAGETTVTVIDQTAAPPPPSGFQVGGVYYDLETTAVFDGPVTVCFSYAAASGGNRTPRLFHYEDGAWVDITTSVDRANKIICGVTTSFSPFAVFESPVVRTGFYAPVSQIPGFVNTVRGGATVPLKFNVYVDGVEQTTTAGLSFGVWATECGGASAEDPVDFTTTGATGLRYDFGAGHFVQNWRTPTASGCYVVRLTTEADGLSISALFKVK